MNGYTWPFASFMAVAINAILAQIFDAFGIEPGESALHWLADMARDIIPILTVFVVFLTLVKMIVEGLKKNFGIDFFYFLRKNRNKEIKELVSENQPDAK